MLQMRYYCGKDLEYFNWKLTLTQKKRNMKIVLALSFVLTTLFLSPAFGQGNQELALSKSKSAAKLQKQGKIDDAIKLLSEANELDPSVNSYAYSLAKLYAQKKSYSKSIKVLKPLINRDSESDSSFLLLGQAYRMAGKTSLAIETFEKGLQAFAESGRLYEELGNIYAAKKDDTTALSYYEKGIELDPNYPGNYYRAAKIFFKGTEKVWGMMYGEIFMNLERKGLRNFEISRLIYTTYKNQISFEGHEREMNMTVEQFIKSDDKYADLMHPFGVAVYEPILTVAMTEEDKINIYALDRIRRNFTSLFFNGEVSKKYPNVLFEYQREIQKAGHLEAYNFWVMRKGDENGFNIWKAAYKQKWAAFEKWFPTFPLILSNEHKLYRALYNKDGRLK